MEHTSHLGPQLFRFCAAPGIIQHLLKKLRPPIPYDLAFRPHHRGEPPQREPPEDREPPPPPPPPPSFVHLCLLSLLACNPPVGAATLRGRSAPEGHTIYGSIMAALFDPAPLHCIDLLCLCLICLLHCVVAREPRSGHLCCLSIYLHPERSPRHSLKHARVCCVNCPR